MRDFEPGNAFQLKNPRTVQPTLPGIEAQRVNIKNSTFLSSGDEDKDKSWLSERSIGFTDNSRA